MIKRKTRSGKCNFGDLDELRVHIFLLCICLLHNSLIFIILIGQKVNKKKKWNLKHIVIMEKFYKMYLAYSRTHGMHILNES